MSLFLSPWLNNSCCENDRLCESGLVKIGPGEVDDLAVHRLVDDGRIEYVIDSWKSGCIEQEALSRRPALELIQEKL